MPPQSLWARPLSSNRLSTAVDVVTVGIAGGSGAGKTTLVRRLQREFADHGVAVVEQDSYYRDLSHLSPAERAGANFDHPDAVEAELLAAQVRALKQGVQVECPVYDFATHTRCGCRMLVPAALVLVEGILVLHWEVLRGLFDLSVFVEQPEQVRYERRLRRDVRDRGRTPESVEKQFASTVSPMHLRFVEPCREYADFIVAGDSTGAAAVERLKAAIDGRLRGQITT